VDKEENIKKVHGLTRICTKEEKEKIFTRLYSARESVWLKNTKRREARKIYNF